MIVSEFGGLNASIKGLTQTDCETSFVVNEVGKLRENSDEDAREYSVGGEK